METQASGDYETAFRFLNIKLGKPPDDKSSADLFNEYDRVGDWETALHNKGIVVGDQLQRDDFKTFTTLYQMDRNRAIDGNPSFINTPTLRSRRWIYGPAVALAGAILLVTPISLPLAALPIAGALVGDYITAERHREEIEEYNSRRSEVGLPMIERRNGTYGESI